MRDEGDISDAKRGCVIKPAVGRTCITVRIDEDVIASCKKQVQEAGGGNHQSLMNVVLRRHMQESNGPLEAALRRIMCEELFDAG